jgi:DNA polymerase-3 subunit gamma/tau
MSLALARKYRPRNFAGVAVQSHVSDTLRGAIARGRVAHGYLLCGPRGTGKTTLARVLAMALNCENRSAEGEPCGECTSCQRIWSGSSSLDVVEIDAASNRGVDDARELRERAMYAPSGEERYKVYIVDEAHMLTREAWNALLKVLEEPPPRVVFVFATTDPQKIAQAAAPVLSRLQRFDLKRISLTEITKRLEAVLESEKIPATADSLAMIARAADGSMRDALSLTDQVISIGEGGITPDRVREALGLVPEDEYLGVIGIIAERRAGDVFGTVARLADGGVDFGVLLSGLGDMLRAQLAVILDGHVEGLSSTARASLESHRDQLSAGDVLRMLSMLSAIEPQFRRSTQQQLLVEMLLVRFALLDRAVSIEEVLQSLGGSSGGAPASKGPSTSGRGPASPPAGRGKGITESRAVETPAEMRRSGQEAFEPRSEIRNLSRPDTPPEAVRSPPTPPLRVTPPAPQRAMDAPAHVDWKSELEQSANSATRPARLTTEAVREERLRMLRAQDPVLDAAVRELDLDLMD